MLKIPMAKTGIQNLLSFPNSLNYEILSVWTMLLLGNSPCQQQFEVGRGAGFYF